MMHYSIAAILFLLSLTGVQAQTNFHSPADLLLLVQSSKNRYEIGPLIKEIPAVKGKVLTNDVYLSIDSTKTKTLHAYKDEETTEWAAQRSKALDLLASSHPAAARKLLNELLKEKPLHSPTLSLLGDMDVEDKEYVKAMTWYDRAVAANPVDYYAHWMRGLNFERLQMPDSALTEIATAHILNRNQERILNDVKRLLQSRYRTWIDWHFAPQYEIHDLDNHVVAIDAAGVWLTYAMYKALWQYEPGYKEQMLKGSHQDGRQFEEMEALLGTYLTYSGMPVDSLEAFPALDALGYAIESQSLETYIVYEIILPEKPSLALYLTPDFIKRLINYLIKVHAPQKM